jgi:hypothetical protein
VTDELEGIWKEVAVMAPLRYYADIHLEVLITTIKAIGVLVIPLDKI